MKHILTLSVLLITTVFAIGQHVGPYIAWDEQNYNFGDIKEDGGKVTHNFVFTNTGNEPLVLTSVRPSCGCTTSDYTKEPVQPGAKGFVSAVFDPLRRPGQFSKSISITTNATNPNTSIRFSGNVIPKPKTLEDIYPRLMGDLRLRVNHVALMRVYNTEVKTDTLGIANTGTKPLKIEFRNVPEHISIKAYPEVLQPGKTGYIKLTYDAKKKNDWGFLMDNITVAVNGDTDKNGNKISVSATIEQDFSKLTDSQKANAPKISFESTVYNFGNIQQGQSVSHVFTLKNQGKSELLLHKINSSCGCAVVEPSSKKIKAGDNAEIKVTFNSKGYTNRQNKTITIITNDPENPQINLRVTGNVSVN